MKATWAALVIVFVISSLCASPNLERARQLEKSGDPQAARELLAQAARSAPDDATAQAEYAEFLDRYGDPACRAAYRNLLQVLRKSGDNARRANVALRLASLDLLAGDRAAGERTLDEFRQASGTELKIESALSKPDRETAHIPGPLRSFARMSAISSDAVPEEVLPALARNVVTNGYQASHSNDTRSE